MQQQADRLTLRHYAVALGLFVLCLAGCTQQRFLTEKDFRDAHLVPVAVEEDRHFADEPITGFGPARPGCHYDRTGARYPTLQEAIAISLESGTTGARGAIGLGELDDNLATYNGGSIVNQVDSIRVLALGPAIAFANMEASLARWDALWSSNMNWAKQDQLSQGLTSFQNGDRANFNSTIGKFLPGGGFVHTSLDVNYTLLKNPPTGGAFGAVNPLYQARVVFGYEQPLLQGFGNPINQLLSRNPPLTGTTLPQGAANGFNQRGLVQQQQSSFVNQGIVDGILVTRLRFDLSRAEFERQPQRHGAQRRGRLLEPLSGLWRALHASRKCCASSTSWLAQRHQKFKAGTLDARQLSIPIRGQYEEFRGERMKALGMVLEAERNLRGLMGLPVEDGKRLVPITPPTLAPYQPDWEFCLQDALKLRPELVLAREPAGRPVQPGHPEELPQARPALRRPVRAPRLRHHARWPRRLRRRHGQHPARRMRCRAWRSTTSTTGPSA